MKHLVILILLFGSILLVESSSILPRAVEDYYWRDYNGLVPSDAIPGGSDERGVATYIGQLTLRANYHQEKSLLDTIPAIITKGSKVAVGAYAGWAINSTDYSNTKVLCSPYASGRYRWYSPTALFPLRCRFVVVGREDDIPLYVGRAKIERQTLIGKIFAENDRHRFQLIVPLNGKEFYPETYEVLTYCY